MCKLIKCILIQISILTLVGIPARAIMAKMAPINYVALSDIISHFEKNKPKDNVQPNVLQWAYFARDAMGVEKLSVYNRISAGQITASNVIDGVKSKIASADWQKLTDEKATKTLKNWRPILEKNFGDKSYSWAWVLFQQGESDAAKKVLQPLFDAEYAKILKLKEAVYGFGGGPLAEITRLEKALTTVSTETEKSAIEKKIKAVKVHVSNLPESHVVT